MNHRQWAEIVQSFINKIETDYPTSSEKMRAAWKKQLQQIKETCDDLLVSWAMVEDCIANICRKYPELMKDETHAIEEDEFFLTASSLRQFREGQGYYRLEMYDSATPLLEQLVEKEPDFLLGRVFLGLCLYQQKRWDAAKSQFDWLASFATANEFRGFAYHMLGCIHLQIEKPKTAIRYFTKVISLLPEDECAWFNLAVCYYQLKQYREAIPALLEVLSRNGDDWEAMFFISKCYYHMQQKENVTFWRLAALEKVNHPQVMMAIAQDYEELGKYKRAIHWYKRLLHHDRKQVIAYRGLSWNYWMLKESERAMSWLKKGLTLFPYDPYLIALYFWICLQLGKTTKAKTLLRFLPEQGPADSIKKLLLSQFYGQSGDVEQAMRSAEQMIRQEKKTISGIGHYQRGRVLLEMGEIDQALQSFQQAKALVTNWKDPIYYEGVCHLMLENPQQARDCWEKINR